MCACPRTYPWFVFDDIPFASRTIPPLTTVRQPIQRIGSLAAETLIEVIEHPENQPRKVILPTDLIVRGRVGRIGVRDQVSGIRCQNLVVSRQFRKAEKKLFL